MKVRNNLKSTKIILVFILLFQVWVIEHTARGAEVTANWGDVVNVDFGFTKNGNIVSLDTINSLNHIYLATNEVVPENILTLFPDASASYLFKFKEAIVGMSVEEEKNFTIASEDAYGDGDLYCNVKLRNIVYDASLEEYPEAKFSGIEDNQIWMGNITINGSVETNNDIKEASVTLKQSTETFLESDLDLKKNLEYTGPKTVAYTFEIHIASQNYPNGSYTLFTHFLDLNGNGMIYHWDIKIEKPTEIPSGSLTSFIGLFSLLSALSISAYCFQTRRRKKKEREISPRR